MKLRNKILALLLAVCLVGGLLPAAALASEEAPAPVETSMTEETPVEDGAPAAEETSIEEEIPVEEETPVEEEIPAEEETPAEDGAPADDADADGYHDGDVAVIQDLLARSSYLSEGADPADPGSWYCVIWTEDAVKRVCELDVSSSGLSGTLDVSALTELYALNCSYTDITELDVSALTELNDLRCSGTAITALDVTANTKLWTLDCGDTGITELDISGLPELEHLYCYGTGLTALDVTANTKLLTLDCGDTEITSLDLSGLTKLMVLRCGSTGIASLDLSGLTKLVELDCSSTAIASLDVSGLPELDHLYCYGTGLTALDVTANTKLLALDCSSTAIASLDLSNCSELEFLYVENTGIASLDLTALSHLSFMGFGAPSAAVNTLKTSLSNVTLNQSEGGEVRMFLDLDEGTAELHAFPEGGYRLTGFEGLPAGADVDLDSRDAVFPLTDELTLSAVYMCPGPNAEEVAVLLDLLECSGKAAEYDLEDPESWDFVVWEEFDGVWRVTGLSLYEWTGLTGELDLSVMTELGHLEVSFTGITALDVSKNTGLRELSACKTDLTALDVTMLPDLRTLDVSYTGIETLDVSGNPLLENLNVSDTGVTALDVTGLPELMNLSCANTDIASLDLSQNPKLESLSADRSKISTLDTTAHEALTEVWFGADGGAQNVLTTDIGTMTLVQSENGTIFVKVDLSTGECGLSFSPEKDCYLKEIKGLPEGAENHGTAITFPWTGGDLTISAEFKKTDDDSSAAIPDGEEESETVPAPEKPDVPNTGDDTPIVLWAVLLLGSGAAAVTFVRRKKEN